MVRKRLKGIVSLNHLFFNKGYLQLRKRQIGSLNKVEVNEILHRILLRQGQKQGLYEKLIRRFKLFWLYLNTKKQIVKRLNDLYKSEPEVFNSFLYSDQIDYEKTLLHANSDDGFIFLNRNYLKQKESKNKAYYTDIVNDLMEFKDTITNEHFFTFIYESKDFLIGDQLEHSPELYGHFFESDFFVSTAINFNNLKTYDPCKKINDKNDIGVYGSHQKDGIYIAFGPDFMKTDGIRGRTFSILDLTPTIFYLQETPIPNNFDGIIMKDVIKPKYIKYNKIEHRVEREDSRKRDESELEVDDKKQIIEKLKELGYID